MQDIPPAPRGVPQIEVTFDIDANGIVHVSAKDKATNKEQSISIKASGGLSDDEINQMVKDAEAHADEDKKRRDLIQQRNAAQEMINGANKMLSENGDKISEDLKNEIKTETDNVQKVLESENTEEIKQASDKLMQVMMKAGELIYKAAQQAQQPGADAGAAGAQTETPKDDNVVDADYEVKEEGK